MRVIVDGNYALVDIRKGLQELQLERCHLRVRFRREYLVGKLVSGQEVVRKDLSSLEVVLEVEEGPSFHE